MAKVLDGYRPIKSIEHCIVDDEKHAFADDSAVNNAKRSRSHYRIYPILFVLLVLSVTLNVATDLQLH